MLQIVLKENSCAKLKERRMMCAKNPSHTEDMALRILFSQALNYPVEQVDVKEEWRFFSYFTQFPLRHIIQIE